MMLLETFFLCSIFVRPVALPDFILRSVGSTSKAGLAWPNGNFVDVNQYLETGKVSWYYTWSPSPIRASIEFVPMLWGEDQVQKFASTINETIANNHITSVLGFNEPQQSGQSNMTPERGAELWMAYIEPLKTRGIRLGTPAPSSAPSGKTWLQQWLQACNGGCNPDFVALHWYDIDADAFIGYLEDFHATFNLPIWVSEWACQNYNGGPQCTKQEIFDFLNKTQSFMDGTSWVERYAWFGVMEDLQGVNPDNAMMDSKGKINALGLQYIGSNSSQISGAASTGVRMCTLGGMGTGVILTFLSMSFFI